MANRIVRARSFLLALALPTVIALLVTGTFAGAAAAEETEEKEWVEADITGKYVGRDDNKGKFREDYNIQSGVDVAFDAGRLWKDGSSFVLKGLGQSGEKQGWVRGEYDDPGAFDLVLDFSQWTEYYNSRDGGKRPSLFPFTNDGEVFYGDGLPSTDWLTTGGSFELEIDNVVHDIYGDFHYRDVDGDQTLLKGGNLDGILIDNGGGPGTGPTNFRFPGRKDVDYKALTGMAGTRSDLLGINWQTDVTYQYHDIDSTTAEPSYCTNSATTPAINCAVDSLASVDLYTEHTDLQLVKYDISGSRNVSSDLFLFGAGFFSWERSDPEPDQFVFETATGLNGTRTTDSSKVTRFTPAASFGGVYRATRDVVIRGDTRIRGHIQDGDLTESRDETQLVTSIGERGRIKNKGDRDAVVSTTQVQADWQAARNLTVTGEARYQYRWDDIDTRTDTNIFGERSEIEKYTQEVHRVKVGPSARYKMRKGRSIEGGYDFVYADVSQDIDELSNQYNLGDYEHMRHRAYLKGKGRLGKKVRGEVRAQYVYEFRDMDGADGADALGGILIPTSSAKAEIKAWSIVPTIHWMPDDQWSLYGTYSIGQQIIEADSGGTFDYQVLTQSLSAGATYRPSEKWSGSGSYTFYHNSDDVENTGHNAALSGTYSINENFGLDAGLRYLHFERDSTSLDDYDAVVATLGVSLKF